MKIGQLKVLLGCILVITFINLVLIIVFMVNLLSVKSTLVKSNISNIGNKLSSIQKIVNNQKNTLTANAPSSSSCHEARQEVLAGPGVSSSGLAALISTCK